MNADIHVFGKEDSVKETYQGFLSRSSPARRRHGLRSRPLSTKKKRHASACLFFLCFHYTIDEHITVADFCNLFFRLVFTRNLIGRFNQIRHNLIELRGVF